jgi:cell division protein FtsI (penicillin-binding protein 3)
VSERVVSLAAHWRVLLVSAVMIGLTAVVCVRVVLLQGEEERSFLQREGDARTIRTLRVPASRGAIYDRRGEPLAVSTPVSSIWADPSAVDLDDSALPVLAELLGYAPEDLRARLARFSDREFLYLRRQVVPSLAEEVGALAIPGIEQQDEYKRYYPAGEVAAHLVGLTDIDDAGLEGIELAYDDWLAGTAGAKRVIRDRRGRIVRDLELIEPVEPGRDLHLSIDLRLQYLAYREVKAAMTQYGAESATVVVLDVATGEVLAMVNQPGYNPNAPVAGDLARMRNRAVTDIYEPGSTMKALTVAAALETGRFGADARIDTAPGWIRVGDKIIEDPVNRGVLDLGGIIAKSSQVGISHIALELEDQMLRDLFARFGLGRSTGVGFPGEAAGRLPGAHRWRDIERVTLAYGYGLAVTPLQLAQAYTVFANDGHMLAPTLLRVDAESEPAAPERVLTPVIASTLTEMLERVVRDDGTAGRAAIPGYRVAGKTGTARKVGADGYDDARHLAWMVGFAPVTAPRIAAVVLVNEPQVERTGGGAVAAPVFARVVSGALRLLNVAPDAALLGSAPVADERVAALGGIAAAGEAAR